MYHKFIVFYDIKELTRLHNVQENSKRVNFLDKVKLQRKLDEI